MVYLKRDRSFWSEILEIFVRLKLGYFISEKNLIVCFW